MLSVTRMPVWCSCLLCMVLVQLVLADMTLEFAESNSEIRIRFQISEFDSENSSVMSAGTSCECGVRSARMIFLLFFCRIAIGSVRGAGMFW
jgi:hypothetical protein